MNEDSNLNVTRTDDDEYSDIPPGSDVTDYGTELDLAIKENNVEEQARLKAKLAEKLQKASKLSLVRYGMFCKKSTTRNDL